MLELWTKSNVTGLGGWISSQNCGRDLAVIGAFVFCRQREKKDSLGAG